MTEREAERRDFIEALGGLHRWLSVLKLAFPPGPYEAAIEALLVTAVRLTSAATKEP